MERRGIDDDAPVIRELRARAEAPNGIDEHLDIADPGHAVDLNAPGGLRDYCARFGSLYHQIAQEAEPRPWSEALVGKVAAERLQELPASERTARQGWRDRRLMGLIAHKLAVAKQES